MAASSVQDLLNFEPHFEGAAVSFIGAALSGYQVVGTLTESELQTPRVEINLQVGSATLPVTRRQGGASPNTQDFVQYDSLFNVRLVTDNTVGQTLNEHSLARAKLRELFLYSATNWTNADQSLTGTFSIAEDAVTLTGVGTSFDTELAIGDKFTLSGEEFTVATITNSFVATVTSAPDSALSGSATRVYSETLGPNNPYYDLKFIQPLESQYLTDDDFNVTEMTWMLKFELRKDAWPS